MNNRPFYFYLFLFAAIGIMATFVFMPSDRELAFMYTKEKYYKSALKILSRVVDLKNATVGEINALMDAYLAMGRPKEALHALEMFVEQNPRRVDALKKLAVLYHHTMRHEEYVEALYRVIQLENNSPSLLEEMISYAKLYQNYPIYMLGLELKLQKEIPRETDFIRDLVYVYLNLGEQERLLKFVTLLNGTPERIKSGMLAQNIYDVLMSIEAEDSAQMIAQNYLLSDNDTPQRIAFLWHLLDLDEGLKALDLAEQALDLEPSASEFITMQLVIRGHMKDSIGLYEELWSQFLDNQIPLGYLGDLSNFVVLEGDPEKIDLFFSNIDYSVIPRKMLFQIIISLSEQENTKFALSKIQDKFQDEPKLNSFMLKFLQLAKLRGVMTEYALGDIDYNLLSGQEKYLFMQLLMATGRRDLAQRELVHFNIDDNFQDVDKLGLAYLFLDLKRSHAGLKLFESMKIKAESAKEKRAITSAQVLLAIDVGDQKLLAEWKKQDYSPAMLLDIYYLAAGKGLNDLALLVAQKYEKAKPGDTANLIVGGAFVRLQRHKAATVYYQRLFQSDSDKYRGQYFSSLIGACGEVSLNGRAVFHRKIRNIYLPLLREAGTKQAVTNIGHGLLNAGMISEATEVFFAMSHRKSVDDEGVQMLAYIWGANPPPKKVAWIKRRTLKASKKQQGDWLKWLNKIARYDFVTKHYESGKLYSHRLDVKEAYLDALVNRNKTEKIAQFLNKEINRSLSNEESLAYAKMLRYRVPNQTIIPLYLNVLKTEPNEPMALQGVAAAYVAENRLEEAQPYLELYLMNNGGSVSQYFTYGEILRKKGETRRADIYYKLSYNLLRKSRRKDTGDKILWVQILSRTGRKQDALEAFSKLLIEYPENSDWRAALAHFFMDESYFLRAEGVLF